MRAAGWAAQGATGRGQGLVCVCVEWREQEHSIPTINPDPARGGLAGVSSKKCRRTCECDYYAKVFADVVKDEISLD